MNVLRGLAVVIGILCMSPAWAATQGVPVPFATIGAAEAAAQNGDTIKIAKGRYTEAIVTTKSLSFVGGSGVFWDGIGGLDQLTATADNVQVSGIEFQNGDDPLTITGTNAVVTKCIFNRSVEGVFITGSNAVVSGNQFFGLQEATEPYAIEVHGPDAVVDKNEIAFCYQFGILVDAQSGGGATVTNNVMDTNQYYGQISVLNATAPVVSKNTIANAYTNNTPVIEVLTSDDARVEGNKLLNLNYDITEGIEVTGQRALVAKNILANVFNYSGNLTCISVTGNDAQVLGNILRSNGGGSDSDTYGIYVTGNNASIQSNRLVDMGGAGDETYGIGVTGDDAQILKNLIDTLTDEYCYGIYVSGARASIQKNKLLNVLYYYFIYVSGDDFQIVGNALQGGAYACEGIYASGNGTTSLAAVISKNSISNVCDTAIDLSGNSALIEKNKARQIADIGIYVSGNGNVLAGNSVTRTLDDAFQVDGDNNELLGNKAVFGTTDGFDITGNGNTLDKCSANRFTGEGLDNDGVGTTATNCKLTGNRIDYAGQGSGTGTITDDTGTKFESGGPTAAQEVD